MVILKGKLNFLLDFSGILSQRCDLPVAQWGWTICMIHCKKRFVDSHKKIRVDVWGNWLKIFE
jgi:hypothetical protein